MLYPLKSLRSEPKHHDEMVCSMYFDPAFIKYVYIVAIFLLYAEIHFRVKGVLNRLFVKEPEIIADIPHRIQPGKAIPILILINDAHLYPVTLLTIDINISIMDKKYHKRFKYCEFIDQPLVYKVLYFNLPNRRLTTARIDVSFIYEQNGKQKICHNDNYRHSSHAPLKTTIDEHPLPRLENWYYGDLHYHSYYTRDQVEFGAPIEAAKIMAEAIGLHFIGCTDHSYDLDDQRENYLQNDPELYKWADLWRTMEMLNRKNNSFVVLAGEELSVGNRHKKNVHMLIFNNKSFIHGSGDGAEKWFANKPENQIPSVLETLDNEALAFSAHSATLPPLSQRLLINRGKWSSKDHRYPRLNGLQFWNGHNMKSFKKGKESWVQLLLMGHKKTIIAGNDAHGNFSRFRQIHIPFFSLKENDHEIFGGVKTAILTKNPLSRATLVKALKLGRAVITDGPFAYFELQKEMRIFHLGDTFPHKNATLRIRGKSTPAFGMIKSVAVFVGDCAEKKEKCYYYPANTYELEHLDEIDTLPGRGYIRLEVLTTLNRQLLSNPIYLCQD